MSKTFCILPWIHLALFPEGSAKICCMASEKISVNGLPQSLQSRSLEEIWNSQYMRDVRRQMVAGTPVKACGHCYHAESVFGKSLRTYSNARWVAEMGSAFDCLVGESECHGFTASELPVYYQLMPGTLCNLKCRMCFPDFSSMIERDRVHRQWTPPLFGGASSGTNQKGIVADQSGRSGETTRRLPNGPWYRDNAWVREVLLKNTDKIRCLYFTGGEPMIEQQVENILEYLIEAGVQENVDLEFNTNCTVLRDSMLEKLQRFKHVVLSLSLDAHGAYHEYIRYPSRWRTIHRNVERLVALRSERLQLSAAPVLQVYNALNLVEILQFLDEIHIHYAIEIASLPWFLSVDVLPSSVRQVAAAKLRVYAGARGGALGDHVLSVASHLESTPDRSNRDSLRTLMLFTNDLDADRGQSFTAVHSELVRLLRDCGFEWTDERSVGAPARTPPEGPSGYPGSVKPGLVVRTVPTFRRWMRAVSALTRSFVRLE